MLLFLTSKDQWVVADWMAAECDRRDIPHLRLYTEKFPQDILVTIKPTNGRLEGNIQLPSHEASIDSITGVWHYLAGYSEPHPDLDPAYAQLVQQQSDETVIGLCLALQDRRWVNHPHRERVAWYKTYQLRLAAQIGLKTPRTIVTNNPQKALDFFHACGDKMVYKPTFPLQLADAESAPTHVAFVTVIKQVDIAAQLESIRVSPCMFQELISSRNDLTVYVIGKNVWATAIHSQGETLEQQVDYRKNGTWTYPYVPTLLPPKVEQMLVEMTQRMGLGMCNFDLLLTQDGEYVFLDANPTDLWAKVEELAGFPLCTAIVDELLGIDTLTDHPYVKDRSLIFSPNTAINELATQRLNR